MLLGSHEPTTLGDLKQGNTFLNRTSCDSEKVLAIGLGEPTITFSKIGRNGESSSIELIDKEIISSWKLLC